jgi:proteasome alpha subunit
LWKLSVRYLGKDSFGVEERLKKLEITSQTFIQQANSMTKAEPRVGTPSKHPQLSERSLKFAKPGMFTPEGRLLQVEWARKCPSGGNLAVAMKTTDGLLLAKGKASMKTELRSEIPCVWHVAQSVAFVATGNVGDMFHVHDMLTSEDTQTFKDAARRIRGILHEHAVSTAERPLALFILLAGFDDGAQKIVNIDVLGSQTECDAWAIGNGDVEARKLLARFWKPSLDRRAGLQLIKKIYGSSAVETCFLPRHSAQEGVFEISR